MARARKTEFVPGLFHSGRFSVICKPSDNTNASTTQYTRCFTLATLRKKNRGKRQSLGGLPLRQQVSNTKAWAGKRPWTDLPIHFPVPPAWKLGVLATGPSRNSQVVSQKKKKKKSLRKNCIILVLYIFSKKHHAFSSKLKTSLEIDGHISET